MSSLRNLNAILSLKDDGSGVDWIVSSDPSLSTDYDAYRFAREGDKFYYPHHITQLPTGNVMLMDDALGRPGCAQGSEKECYTRAAEYAHLSVGDLVIGIEGERIGEMAPDAWVRPMEKLVIKHCMTNASSQGRRRTYRAHGRVTPYQSGPCHIQLFLEEKLEWRENKEYTMEEVKGIKHKCLEDPEKHLWIKTKNNQAVKNIFHHIRRLHYADKPDYEGIRQQLLSIYEKTQTIYP